MMKILVASYQCYTYSNITHRILNSSPKAEETKVLRLQLELSQAKGDLERRVQEKEEELEAVRYLISLCDSSLVCSTNAL